MTSGKSIVVSGDTHAAEVDSLTSLIEKQMHFVAYGVSLSFFSPVANLWALTKLYPSMKHALVSNRGLSTHLVAQIYPHQVLLRIIQVNLALPVMDYMSPWISFGLLGILQGGVYGHANIHFAKKLGINHSLTLRGVFRGSGCAAARDMISQGIPFMFSNEVNRHVLNKVWPSQDPTAVGCKKWAALLGTSVIATYLSQGLHNWQTAMQTHSDTTYAGAMRSMYSQHGTKMMWKGAEARVGLLLVTNILNEIFLKPVWNK